MLEVLPAMPRNRAAALRCTHCHPGQPSSRTLGVVLYECLSGHRPFEAESFSAVVLMAGTEPPPPMDLRIPRGLQAVVLRCLEKDRQSRFSSIAELVTALLPFAHDQRTAATIADRANLLLRQRPSGAIEAPVHSEQLNVETTLSGSAGSADSRSRHRRYAIVGALLGVFVILAAVIKRDNGHLQSTSEGQRIGERSHDAEQLLTNTDGISSGSLPAGAKVHSSAATAPDAATIPREVTEAEKTQMVGKCTELFVQRVGRRSHTVRRSSTHSASRRRLGRCWLQQSKKRETSFKPTISSKHFVMANSRKP